MHQNELNFLNLSCNDPLERNDHAATTTTSQQMKGFPGCFSCRSLKTHAVRKILPAETLTSVHRKRGALEEQEKTSAR